MKRIAEKYWYGQVGFLHQVEYETYFIIKPFIAVDWSFHSLTVCLCGLGARGNAAEAAEGKWSRQPWLLLSDSGRTFISCGGSGYYHQQHQGESKNAYFQHSCLTLLSFVGDGIKFFHFHVLPQRCSLYFYMVLWVYVWSVRGVCLSFVACAAVLLCIWWRSGRGGGRPRGRHCRAAGLPWRYFGVCAGGASGGCDGCSPRAPAWWGKPCLPGRVRAPLKQCGARTLLLFLPRWVIPCTPALSFKGFLCPPKSDEVDFQLVSTCFAAVREMLQWGSHKLQTSGLNTNW